jgi:hypothetical protein
MCLVLELSDDEVGRVLSGCSQAVCTGTLPLSSGDVPF